MTILRRTMFVLLVVGLVAGARDLHAQAPSGPPAPPGAGLGRLTQNDLSLHLSSGDLDIRFIPLDPRVTRLLAPDSWTSLRSLVESRRPAIDSVSRSAGVARPGLALVTFFAQRANARFDPQTLTVSVRSRVLRPLGIVPFTARFTSQQLDVREQVSAIYLFEEDLPVNDSFTVSYAGQTSDDWLGKQPQLDRERARVALREHGPQRDTVPADSGR